MYLFSDPYEPAATQQVVDEAEQLLADEAFEPRPGCCVDCDDELAARTAGGVR